MGPIEKKEYKDFKFSREQLSLPKFKGRGEGAGVPSVSCKWMPLRPTPLFLRLKRGFNNVHYVKELSLSYVF